MLSISINLLFKQIYTTFNLKIKVEHKITQNLIRKINKNKSKNNKQSLLDL